MKSHGNALHDTTLYCIAWHCMTVYDIYVIAWYCILWHLMVLHAIA